MTSGHQGAQVIELFRTGWRFEDGEHRRYAAGRRVGRVWREDGEWKLWVRTDPCAIIDAVDNRVSAMELVDDCLETAKAIEEDESAG